MFDIIIDLHSFRTLRNVTWLAMLALVGATLRPSLTNAQQPAATVPLVFDGVTVIDVTQGQRIPAQRLVIVGNHIQAMGSVSTVRVPAGARVVDAKGKYMIPGLWDMHTHARRAADIFYPLFIANGITGIRDAGSEVPLDTMIQWRREILAGTRVGPPRQLLAGSAIDQANPCTREKDLHTCVSDSADARHLVDSLKAAGADMIKTYTLSRGMYFVIAAEARRVGILFGGHDTSTSAIEASDSGASLLDHPTTSGNTAGGLAMLCLRRNSTAEQCGPVAERFRRNGTWWVPTLFRAYDYVGVGQKWMTEIGTPCHEWLTCDTIFTRFYKFARQFGADSALHPDWQRGPAGVDSILHSRSLADTGQGGVLKLAHRVGLPILAGTDAVSMTHMPPGFVLHAELAIYVAEGLTPLEALQAATLNPAKLLHRTDSLGTVAPGKLADLVLLDADPLVNISNTTKIRAVVANGRYFDQAALDQLLVMVQAKVKQGP